MSKETGKRGDAEAKKWASEVAGRFGKSVQSKRVELGLSAVQLSERTKELGYPITRATIAKIENNQRNAKMDFAEIIVLALALRTPAMLLLFPEYPDGLVEFVPGIDAPSFYVVEWLSGIYEVDWGDKPEDARFVYHHSPLFRLARERQERGDIFSTLNASMTERFFAENNAKLVVDHLCETEKKVAELNKQIVAEGGYVTEDDNGTR